MKRILLSPEAAIAPATGALPPKPAPAPTPAPKPEPKAEPKPEPSPNDPFSSMDDKITAKRKPDAPKEPKVEKPEGDPEPEKPEGDLKPDAVKPKVDQGPKALREQLEKVNGELKTERASIAELRKKVEDYEAKGKDSTTLAERLAAREKEFEVLQGEVRALKHEASPEFKAKYERPFNRAAEHAKTTIEQLQVTEPDGNTRPAKWEDFTALYNLPLGKAMTTAKELFGEGAQVAITHLTKLKDMQDEKDAALRDERTQAVDRIKGEDARRAQEKEAVDAMWAKVNADIAKKRPEWYQPEPEDKEGNDLLKEGYDTVDSKPETLQDQVIRNAHIRNRAAAFPRMAWRLDRAKEQIKDLEAQIEELKGSAPGKTRRTTGDQPPAEKGWKEEMRDTLME